MCIARQKYQLLNKEDTIKAFTKFCRIMFRKNFPLKSFLLLKNVLGRKKPFKNRRILERSVQILYQFILANKIVSNSRKLPCFIKSHEMRILIFNCHFQSNIKVLIIFTYFFKQLLQSFFIQQSLFKAFIHSLNFMHILVRRLHSN